MKLLAQHDLQIYLHNASLILTGFLLVSKNKALPEINPCELEPSFLLCPLRPLLNFFSSLSYLSLQCLFLSAILNTPRPLFYLKNNNTPSQVHTNKPISFSLSPPFPSPHLSSISLCLSFFSLHPFTSKLHFKS